MLKLLILGLCIFLAYKLFSNDLRHKSKSENDRQKKETEKKAASGELVKDPICGSYVSKDDSLSVRDGEKVAYFCSYECRDIYLKQLAQDGHELPLAFTPPEDEK
jgi:YHS domain-containing protein